jgi:hypothetical protein
MINGVKTSCFNREPQLGITRRCCGRAEKMPRAAERQRSTGA